MSTLTDLRRNLAPWQRWLLDVGVPSGCALVALMFRDELESGWVLVGALALAAWLIVRPRWSLARLVPRLGPRLAWRRRTAGPERAEPAAGAGRRAEFRGPGLPVGPVPRWLINAAVALALVLATVQIGGDIPDDWWVFGGLLVAGLLVQHRWPWLAVALAATGAFADMLLGYVFVVPLDLAAPITVYTLASRADRRRSGVVAVAALFVAVFTLSLVHQVAGPATTPVPYEDVPAAYVCPPGDKPHPTLGCVSPESLDLEGLPADKRAAVDDARRRKDAVAAGEPAAPALPAGKVPYAGPVPEGKPVLPPDDRGRPVDRAWVDPGATALDQLRAIDPTDVGALRTWFADRTFGALGTALFPMLVLGLALAFGDGVRSRRGHLLMLEQRASDLEREQHQRAALAAAAERARITRELHDVVAHGMSVMVVQAQGGAAALRRHPDRTATALENVITTGRASLAEMRRLLGVVSRDPADDPQLAPQPGLCSVPALVDQVRAAGTEVHLYVDGQPPTLPASVDLSAYRIVQEALTNTIKHAGPGARAEVRLVFAPDWVEVEITDDGAGGSGSAVPAAAGGNGLRGIAERVAAFGGELAVGPGAGGRGFRVWALLPILAADET